MITLPFFFSALCLFSGCTISLNAPETPEMVQEISVLSEQEKNDLLFLFEEEQLAHDVYVTLYEKWGNRVFSNIIASEEKHATAVSGLLKKFSIPFEEHSTTLGKFQNPELQKLYDDLVKKGISSQKDAFEVGVFIEEYDISDIEKKMKNTKNTDILSVYENLKNGSENHLAAFNKNLNKKS